MKTQTNKPSHKSKVNVISLRCFFSFCTLSILLLTNFKTYCQTTNSYPENLGQTYNNEAQYAMDYYYGASGTPIGYILAGSSFEYSTNNSNIRVMAKDFAGNTLWSNEGNVYGIYQKIDRAFAVSHNPVTDCYLICGYKRNGGRDDLALLYIKNNGAPLWYNTYQYSSQSNPSSENSLYGLDIEFDHITQGSGSDEFIVVGFHSEVPVDDKLGFTNYNHEHKEKGYFAAKIEVTNTGSSMTWSDNYIDVNTSIAATNLAGDLNRFSGFNDINFDPITSKFYVTGTGQFYDPTIVWGANFGLSKVFAEIDENTGQISTPGTGSPGPDMKTFYGLLQAVWGYRSFNEGDDHYILGFLGAGHGFDIVKWNSNTNIITQKRYECSVNPMDMANILTAYNIFEDPSDPTKLIVTGYASDRGTLNDMAYLLASSAFPFITKIDKTTLNPVINSSGHNVFTLFFVQQQGYWGFPLNHYFANNALPNPLMYTPQHSLPLFSSAGVGLTCASKGINSSCEPNPPPANPLPTFGLSYHNDQFNTTLTTATDAGSGSNLFVTECCSLDQDIKEYPSNLHSSTVNLISAGVPIGPVFEQLIVRSSFDNHSYCVLPSDPNHWRQSNTLNTAFSFDASVSPNPISTYFTIKTSLQDCTYSYNLQASNGSSVLKGEGKGSEFRIQLASPLASGIYVLKLTESKTKSTKVIKINIE